MLYSHILIPTDFSETANHALNFAFEEARQHHAHLTLLHVMHHHPKTEVYYIKGEPGSRTGYADDSGGRIPSAPASESVVRRDAEEEILEQLHQLVPTTYPGSWEAQIVAGDPADAIVHASEELPADLIIIGTHGRTGLQHILLGSVAEKVVRHASCPVLTVRYRAQK